MKWVGDALAGAGAGVVGTGGAVAGAGTGAGVWAGVGVEAAGTGAVNLGRFPQMLLILKTASPSVLTKAYS